MDISVEESRERARVTEQHIENTAYTKYPGNYHGKEDSWDLEDFKTNFKAVIVGYHKGRDLELDLIGIGPAIANAYRRIMIAEVPTMAIEHCFIYNNTSVIQDEMLAHRMGLIPIRANPTLFGWKPKDLGPDNTSSDFSIVFDLEAKCEKLANYDSDKSGLRKDLYKDYKVYSSHLKWKPLAGQDKTFVGKDVIRAAHKNLIIAKLSCNQEISLKLHANKGIGRDHAKFSPVATASYRLMPDIKLKNKVTGEAAQRLKDSFSPGVIELIGRDKAAKVVNPRVDSGSRNVFRYPDLKDQVIYDLIKEHFIFKIESSGCMPALEVFLQSCDILESKCKYFLDAVKAHHNSTSEEPEAAIELW